MGDDKKGGAGSPGMGDKPEQNKPGQGSTPSQPGQGQDKGRDTDAPKTGERESDR